MGFREAIFGQRGTPPGEFETPGKPLPLHETNASRSETASKANKVLNIIAPLNFLRVPIKEETDPLMSAYLGDPTSHASYHNSTPEKPPQKSFAENIRPRDALSPYALMVGDLHLVFRRKLIPNMGIALDESALPQSTRDLMKQLADNQHRYGQIVDSLFQEQEKLTGVKFVSKATLESSSQLGEAEQNCIDICHDLKIALDAKNPIPIIIKEGDKSIKTCVPYEERIAGILYSLPLASMHMAERYKVPPPMTQFFVSYFGEPTKIPRTLHDIFKKSPLLAERYDKALAEQLPEITASIRKGQHTLEVMTLLRDRPSLATYTDPASELLRVINATKAPAQISLNSEEYGLLLDTLKKKFPAETDALKLLETFRSDTPAGTGQGLAALASLKQKRNDYITQRQIGAAEDYIRSYNNRFINPSSSANITL